MKGVAECRAAAGLHTTADEDKHDDMHYAHRPIS